MGGQGQGQRGRRMVSISLDHLRHGLNLDGADWSTQSHTSSRGRLLTTVPPLVFRRDSTLMYNHRVTKVDCVDLDPYGTAAPFLDAALQATADGGASHLPFDCVRVCTSSSLLTRPQVCLPSPAPTWPLRLVTTTLRSGESRSLECVVSRIPSDSTRPVRILASQTTAECLADQHTRMRS